MKKGTCKRFMAMAMSLVTALGTGFGGEVNMVYAANSFKAGDTVQVKYLHNNVFCLLDFWTGGGSQSII